MADTDKILVVEDDETLRLLTTKQLARLGFQSDAVEDGLHALQYSSERTYGLILMDVQMPQMDGIEATTAIRKAESENNRKRVTIIAMTANPDRSLCLKADMDDFLFKPVMLPELQNILHKWLPKTDENLKEPQAKSSTPTSAPDSPAIAKSNAKSESSQSSRTQTPAIAPSFGFGILSQPAADASMSMPGSQIDTACSAEAIEPVESAEPGPLLEQG